MTMPYLLEGYARLATQVAIPVQPGHHLLIVSPPEGAEVARAIIRAAYASGAAGAEVLYDDPQVSLDAVLSASPAHLAQFPAWMAAALTDHAASGQPVLTLHAPTPRPLPEAFAARSAASTLARNRALERYGMLRSRVQFNWSVMALATSDWATFLRPDLPSQQALDWLWAVLARLLRLDQADPVKAWEEHARHLMCRCESLNHLKVTEMHVRAPGSDLTVGLPAGHRWFGPLVPSAQGLAGIPNLPTEEISTLPHRLHAEGAVRSTRPLVLQGQRIEGLALTFSGGQVKTVRATSGQRAIEALLDTDEGASRLGEVALVAEDALVAREGRIFYSTLIDENAACHLALGRAYPVTLEGGDRMDLAAFQNAGGNHSQVHLDFMIGSPELDVRAASPQGEVVLMRQGRWVGPG